MRNVEDKAVDAVFDRLDKRTYRSRRGELEILEIVKCENLQEDYRKFFVAESVPVNGAAVVVGGHNVRNSIAYYKQGVPAAPLC